MCEHDVIHIGGVYTVKFSHVQIRRTKLSSRVCTTATNEPRMHAHAHAGVFGRMNWNGWNNHKSNKAPRVPKPRSHHKRARSYRWIYVYLCVCVLYSFEYTYMYEKRFRPYMYKIPTIHYRVNICRTHIQRSPSDHAHVPKVFKLKWLLIACVVCRRTCVSASPPHITY